MLSGRSKNLIAINNSRDACYFIMPRTQMQLLSAHWENLNFRISLIANGGNVKFTPDASQFVAVTVDQQKFTKHDSECQT